jgi:DNA (cytosine-5)-methyltransferase 1
MTTPGILSLCTGYAGLDMAVEAVTGARTVAVADIDKGARLILDHRYADVPNLGDVKAIDWTAWAGTDVMTAGYPCQPFSHAGKREGTNDPRHIFPYIVEGIRLVGPRLVVLENVRGHLGLGFDTVLGALADVGYDARWLCLRASDVGAPHHRARLFIAATPTRDTDRPGLEGWPTNAERADQRVVGPHGLGAAADPRGERHGRGKDTPGVGRVDGPHAGETPQRQRSRQEPVDRSTAAQWGPYAPAVARWEHVTGRPAPDPLDAGRLSPRAVEWMMGLPAGWVTDVPGLSRNAQLKALGNGVVLQQAATALAHLLAPALERAA